MNTSLLSNILNSFKDSVLFVDTDHVIRYMNSVAKRNFKQGEALIGQSIFDCHNEASCNMMREIFAAMQQGEEERLITDNAKHRIYMRAVRDENGELIGYFERYEPPVKTI